MKKIAVAIMAICMSLSMCACSGTNTFSFQYWNEDAQSLENIRAYVEDVTNENSENYILVEDRVAVFDMDGTLYSENSPTYFLALFFISEIMSGKNPNITDEMKAFVDAMLTGNTSGLNGDSLPQLYATLFDGMTVDEFNHKVKAFVDNTPVQGYDNLNYADAFFLPMLEIVDYLSANDFNVYLCSGTDRLTCRALTDGKVNILGDHVIGADVALYPSNYYGDGEGKYEYSYEDELVRSSQVLTTSTNGAKVNKIAAEIGKQPVMVFGNSDGDSSMATYATDENPHKTMVVMLAADDEVRENGNPEKATNMRKLWEANGWNVISMKNDWNTVFGDNVIKK